MNEDRSKRPKGSKKSKKGKDDGNNTIEDWLKKVGPREKSHPSYSGSYISKKQKLAKDPPGPESDGEAAGAEAQPPAQQYRFLMNRCEVSLPVKPYPTQIAIMNAITKSANKSENVLIESATGTGKSLALICASLAAARRLTMTKLEAAHPRPPQMPSELPAAPVNTPESVRTVASQPQPQLHPQPQPQPKPVSLPQQQNAPVPPPPPQPPKVPDRFMGLPLKPHVNLESLKTLQSHDEHPVNLQEAQLSRVCVKTESNQSQFTQPTQPTQFQSDLIYLPQFSQQTQPTQSTQPIQLQPGHSIYSQQTRQSQITQPTQPTQFQSDLIYLPQFSQQTQPTQPIQLQAGHSIYSQLIQQPQQTQITVKTENNQSQSTQPTQPIQLQPGHSIYSQQTQSTQQPQPNQLQSQKNQPFQKPIVVRPSHLSAKHADAGGFIPSGDGAPQSHASSPAEVPGSSKNLVRVFYGTRTHSQVKQIVKEVRRTMYKPLTVVLASRKHYCIFDRVRNSPDRDDTCVKIMLKKVKLRCPYANTESLKKFVRQSCGTTKVPGTEYEHVDYNAYDVEDLVTQGRKLGSCPYLSMNELVEEAEFVVSPYNYIISETIRSSRHINLSDDIVVIDEAHNISSALMEVASYDFPLAGVRSVCITLRTAAKTGAGILPKEYRASLRYAARILNAIASWMEKVESTLIRQDFEHYYKCWRGAEILEIYKSFGLVSKEHITLFTYTIDCACGKTPFVPEAVAPFKAVLKLSGLLEEEDAIEDDGATGFEGAMSASAMAQGLKEEEPKYYRKESKISKPKHSRDSASGPADTVMGSIPLGKKGGGVGGKGMKRSLFDGIDDDDKAPSILEGPEMICATMASSSAGFILSHPEYANDYRLVVDKATVFVGGQSSSRGSSNYRNAGGASKEWVMSMGLWCMSPAVAFKGIDEPSRSVVLASGTLAPFDPLVQELRAPFPTRVELSHVIDKCQVIACTAKRYEISYSTTDSLDVQDYVGRSVLECCRVIPSGVLCFLPSFSLLSKLINRWKDTGLYDEILAAKGGNVYSELDVSKPQSRSAAGAGSSDDTKNSSDDAKFSVFINNFHASARTPEGALLFAVCRGKSSEGVDFADESARGVIVVGTPYSNTHDVRISLKREYEEAAVKGGGTRWYLADGHRAVNQAIGRIIRNKWDYGAVVFLDARYTRLGVKAELSKWIRNQIYEVDTVHDFVPSLRDFFENIPPYVMKKKEEFMSKMASQSSQASQTTQMSQMSQTSQSTQSTQIPQIKTEITN